MYEHTSILIIFDDLEWSRENVAETEFPVIYLSAYLYVPLSASRDFEKDFEETAFCVCFNQSHLYSHQIFY